MGELERRRIAQLEAELGEALERIRQLESHVCGLDWACPVEFGLTVTEARVLATLVAQERCTKELLHLATARPGRDAETDPKIVDVMICKMRRKLKRFGIVIETLWGVGYYLRPQDRDRLRTWHDRGRGAA